jgi:hypothetical protein
VLGVSSVSPLERRCRQIDGRDPTVAQAISHLRDGNARPTADFEYPIVGLNLKQFHGPPDPSVRRGRPPISAGSTGAVPHDGLLHCVAVLSGLQTAEGGFEFAEVDHKGRPELVRRLPHLAKGRGENMPATPSSAGPATLA